MADVPRVIVTTHDGTIVGDLDPARLAGLVVVSEVNGENAMTVTTTQELAKGDRLLWQDGMGVWHEYVIESDECEHDMPDAPMHEYYAVWSVQHDLSGTYLTSMPGTGGTPATAFGALTAVLDGTDRWVVGTVDVLTTGSASFWRKSGWESMQTLVEVWGGEVQATIEVGVSGVTARKVDLLQHVGATTATRRYDYGHDATGVTRTVEDQLWTARVMPLGAAEETESGGYGRKITIDEVNGGVAWLEDASAVPYTRVPNGSGGWEVPVQIVENSECKTPADLKAWALDNLETWTTPKVSYEVDVAQLDRAGESALGVALGDECSVVDSTFCDGGLRLTARVMRIEDDLLDPTRTTLTISNLRDTLGDQLASLATATAEATAMLQSMSVTQSTRQWLQGLLDRLNDEINATGGYTYITEGQGIRTYDVAVTDPLVGSEASKVVEIKGGTIRIADSRTSGGDWDWRTVFTSGHIAADLVTAAQLQAGYIGSATSGNYWNLDTGDLRIAATATLGGTTVTQMQSDISGASSAAASAQQAVSDLSTQQAIFDLLTNGGTIQGLYMSGGQLYVNASYIQSGTLRLGGANNVNGIMQVLNDTSDVVVDLSNDGAVLSHPTRFRGGSGAYTYRSLLEVSEIETTSERLRSVLTQLSSGYTDAYHIPAVMLGTTTGDMATTYGHVYFVPRMYTNQYPDYYKSSVYSDAPLQVVGGIDLSSSDTNVPMLYAGSSVTAMMYGEPVYVYTGSSVKLDQSAAYVMDGKVLLTGDLVAIHGRPTSAPNAIELDSSNTLTIGHTGANTVTTTHTGPVTITGTLTVSGTKSRVTETDYGNRLLYCDETPAPTFTDFGSGTIGEDGLCYVELDPIFADTVNTSMAYQVFLQKCGRGDLWVSEKRPGYFVVEGDAGLPFDWQLKAHQSGYETLRLEDRDIERASVDNTAIEADQLEALYDTDYASEIEALYDTDLLGEAA